MDRLADMLTSLDPAEPGLLAEFNNNPAAVTAKWVLRSREDWKEISPRHGVDIYNFLRAQPERRRETVLLNAFPPLGPRELSCSVSKTRKESCYNITITTVPGTFGVLTSLKRQNLNQNADSLLWTIARNSRQKGRLRAWNGENSVQATVMQALVDCDVLMGGSNLDIHTEVTFSLSRIIAKHQDRVDVTTIVNDTKNIVGVCEIKLPGFDLNSVCQIVDYMVDLRNSFNVRYVFGIFTTYEKWRILWFADTNHAAEETDQDLFDQLCHTGSANEYSISDRVTVHMSPIFDFFDPHLIEVLVSVLYKMGKSPVSLPFKFIETQKKYILAKMDTFIYESLPSEVKTFSYIMPGTQYHNFYVLQYYHRGGDGRIALCCSSGGHLCVAKFLLNPENEKTELEREADLWNRLWGTECRVVELNHRSALLMPFCFHIRIFDGKPLFCSLPNWNSLNRTHVPSFPDHEVSDFSKMILSELDMYQRDPLKAAARRCLMKTLNTMI